MKKLNTPGVKECPIEEAAVVVVAHKVPGDGLPGAGLGHNLIGHCDLIFGVVEVQEHHVKHQRRLSRDVAAWRQRHQRKWRPAGGLLDPVIVTLSVIYRCDQNQRRTFRGISRKWMTHYCPKICSFYSFSQVI